MNRKFTIPAIALGLGLGAVALSPTLATAESVSAVAPAAASGVSETHQADGDHDFSLTVDDIDVAAGTAHVTGTAEKSDYGNVQVNGVPIDSWSIEDGPVGTTFEGEIRGLVPGANSISAKLVDSRGPDFVAEAWKTVATIPTFDLQAGTGTGFTATASHDAAAGTVTVSGTYTPGLVLVAGSARSGVEWDEYMKVNGDGTYSMTVSESTWGQTDVFISNDNDFRAGITRIIPASEVVEH
jgi:hypothetical protein